MATARELRERQRQLGQYMTPVHLAKQVVSTIDLSVDHRILEPGFGTGAFLVPLIERCMALRDGTDRERFMAAMTDNVAGIELDSELYWGTLREIEERWGPLPDQHRLVNANFFDIEFVDEGGPLRFDHVVGNPPFGATIAAYHQDALDRRYGARDGHKIKKESYSFFLVKSLDSLAEAGRVTFICSDTFLTINTMQGLRRLLFARGTSRLVRLAGFSEETDYPMVVLRFSAGEGAVLVDDVPVSQHALEATGNFSWGITDELLPYFTGTTIASVAVCTSGMTIGSNESFVREIEADMIREPYRFVFYDDPITVEGETARARLHRLSPKRLEAVAEAERRGATRRNVRIVPREEPIDVALPHPEYRPYNKAQSGVIYAPPRHVVFWKDEGDAVLTYKRNGNWYLHGVGGARFFGREGLTWSLVSNRLNARYLEPGAVLDSGAPCLFLHPGVAADELFFLLGWMLTSTATRLVKTVLNHTRNIQGKDVERLPYPAWVGPSARDEVIVAMKGAVQCARDGHEYTRQDALFAWLDERFSLVA